MKQFSLYLQQSKFRILIWGLCLLPAFLLAQPQVKMVTNDHCAQAITLEVNSFNPGHTNENATVGPDSELPPILPKTCIYSFENDVWFHFKTIPDYQYYEIVIGHEQCSTPAGLQALLVQTDKCNAADFSYKGCSNKQTQDTIKLFLDEKTPGLDHLIYVDGFDGTVCSFSIGLFGHKEQPVRPSQYKYVNHDYDVADLPKFEPAGLKHRFENNTFTLQWSAPSEEDASLFIIQRIPDYLGTRQDVNPDYLHVVGTVESKALVGGGDIWYEFTDDFTSFKNKAYCYRVVKLDSKGEKSYSEFVCFDAEVIESFFVGNINKGSVPGTYQAHYINKVKKQNFDLYVLNSKQEVVKAMKMEKEPIRDGMVTINMAAFDPGVYQFKMGNGTQYFMREFIVDGK